jgi:hypothetical protein
VSCPFSHDQSSQVEGALITARSLTKLERFPIRDRTASSKMPTPKSQRVVFSRTRRAARYCALRRYCQFHIWGVFPLSTQFNALHGATAKTINNNLKTATLTTLHNCKLATITETYMLQIISYTFHI